MDLAKFDELTVNQEAGVLVDIKHPTTGKSIGLTIKVASFESKRGRAANSRIIKESSAGRPRGVRFSPDEIEENARKLLSACILGWTFDDEKIVDGETIPATTIDGKKPDFNPVNVRAVFERFPWISEQCDTAASDRSRFLES